MDLIFLPPGPITIPMSFRINLEAQQSRRIGRQFLARESRCVASIFSENMNAGGLGLTDGIGNNFDRQNRNLHVHLQGG